MSQFSSDHFDESFKNLSIREKHEFIDNFLKICEPHDLFYISSKLEVYKKDFISLMPIEVVENILGYLDWQSLINCCQVNSN